jgi:hypothetical protein
MLRIFPSDTDDDTLRGVVLERDTTPVLGIPPNRTWTNGSGIRGLGLVRLSGISSRNYHAVLACKYRRPIHSTCDRVRYSHRQAGARFMTVVLLAVKKWPATDKCKSQINSVQCLLVRTAAPPARLHKRQRDSYGAEHIHCRNS